MFCFPGLSDKDCLTDSRQGVISQLRDAWFQPPTLSLRMPLPALLRDSERLRQDFAEGIEELRFARDEWLAGRASPLDGPTCTSYIVRLDSMCNFLSSHQKMAESLANWIVMRAGKVSSLQLLREITGEDIPTGESIDLAWELLSSLRQNGVTRERGTKASLQLGDIIRDLGIDYVDLPSKMLESLEETQQRAANLIASLVTLSYGELTELEKGMRLVFKESPDVLHAISRDPGLIKGFTTFLSDLFVERSAPAKFRMEAHRFYDSLEKVPSFRPILDKIGFKFVQHIQTERLSAQINAVGRSLLPRRLIARAVSSDPAFLQRSISDACKSICSGDYLQQIADLTFSLGTSSFVVNRFAGALADYARNKEDAKLTNCLLYMFYVRKRLESSPVYQRELAETFQIASLAIEEAESMLESELSKKRLHQTIEKQGFSLKTFLRR